MDYLVNRQSRCDSDIVGIAPASGVWAVYSDASGSEFRSRVHLWGVRHDGTVVPLEAYKDGLVDASTEADNFLRLDFDESIEG